MKLLCLTTNTLHHNFFVRQLNKVCSSVSVVIETSTAKPEYETQHVFETERDQHEGGLWGLEALPLGPQDDVEIHRTPAINNCQMRDIFPTLAADLCIVFGTRRINSKIIELLPKHSFNLHGGDPRRYRGLDSHYWSIWHGDKNGLQTCLHQLTPDLDDGPIADIQNLDLNNVNSLCKLRAENTRLCVAMCSKFIIGLQKNAPLKLLKQEKKGRYYSYMPRVLKNALPIKFKKLKEELS